MRSSAEIIRPPSACEWKTLLEMVRARAALDSEVEGFAFLEDGEDAVSRLSYGGLDERVRAVAAHLQAKGAAGERLLLLYPPGLDYITGFFASLFAGGTAVPAYPPDPARLQRTLPRLVAIAEDAEARWVLTTSAILSMAEMVFDFAPSLRKLNWVATDAIEDDLASQWYDPGKDSQDLAVLQYTSGSTGVPKGVMLTHANLLHNSAIIHTCFRHSPSSRGVIWLPPYHDMGLIGGILQPIYGGFPVTLMSPISFLQRPYRWLKAVSKWKATTSGGPNFAYELCVRKITEEERAGLDFSSWKVAFNGAEPVRAESLERFNQTFGPCGFEPEAAYPCYGLAEGTLIVTGSTEIKNPTIRSFHTPGLERDVVLASRVPCSLEVAFWGPFSEISGIAKNISAQGTFILTEQACELGTPLRLRFDDILSQSFEMRGVVVSVVGDGGTGLGIKLAFDSHEQQKAWEKVVDEVAKKSPVPTQKESQRLVGCGPPVPEAEVIIVHPESMTRCWPGQVGEVWVRGESVSPGYWRRDNETSATFKARLADTGEGPFLRTGDLGFVQDDELFFSGRLKDLIIIRGVDHYPQDIELTVERVHTNFLRPGCGAAFSVEECGEERLVVVQEVDRRFRGERRSEKPPDKPPEALVPRESERRQPDIEVQAFAPIEKASKEYDAEELVAAIRQAVGETHGIQVYAVALLKPGTIPKTSSGKVQRHACRTAFVSGTLEPVVDWRLETTATVGPLDKRDPIGLDTDPQKRGVQEWLANMVASKLGFEVGDLDVRQPLSHYGLDSLLTVEVQNEIEGNLGVVVPMANLLRDVSIADIAARALSQGRGDQVAVRLPKRAEAAVSHAPPSFGQLGLWYLYQIEPTSVAYHIASAVWVLSEVDLGALRGAFQRLIDRHAALRTTFEVQDGVPVQRIRPDQKIDYEEIGAESFTEQELRKALSEAANERFDMAAGPLFRVRLFRREDGKHALLVVVHHSVADLWSMAVLANDLAVLYESEHVGTEPRLVPPAIEYTDYSRWQRELLNGEEGEQLWAYWQERLGNDLQVLDLPTDRPRSAVQTFNGAVELVHLDPELTDVLRKLAKSQQATLNMVLLAGFSALMSRYSRQDEVVVGTVSSDRSRAALAGIVGFIANTLVLRNDVGGDPTFIELADRVRQTLLSALEHQDLPFPLLVERLEPVRDPSRSPLFQVMFVFQKAPMLHDRGLTPFALGVPGMKMDLGALELQSLDIDQPVSLFDLTMTMAESEGGLIGSLQYNTDLFDRTTARRMLDHLTQLLRGVADKPHACPTSLSILTEAETSQLLVEWNDTDALVDEEDVCLHQLIAQQAACTPDAMALVFDGVSNGEQLTYSELLRRTDSLAAYLQSLGIGPGALIGVWCERSVEMVIGLLAAVKAGGAYVPLDPKYPQERLEIMQADAGLSIILSHGPVSGNFAVDQLCVRLDEDWSSIEAAGTTVDEWVNVDDAAYMIYTSGSTGRPKGVINHHAGIVNRLRWMQAAYGLSDTDTVLQKTPATFDVSVWEFFWTLMSSARLVMAKPEGHKDPRYIASVVQAEQVTVMHFVPSVLNEFVEEADVAGCVSLRQVLASGEALPLALQLRFNARNPAPLDNLYGPTEAAIDVTSWSCRGSSRHAVPIGRPIDNIRVHLLDVESEPASVGIRDEIYLSGIGLARGYLGRTSLTAQTFVTSVQGVGQRMYRTGDIGSRWPEGVVEYSGRRDHQVKLRGLRIELGDIEAALGEHPFVRECVVMLRNQVHGESLTAYVVLRNSWETGETNVERQDQTVQEWEEVYDSTYQASASTDEDPSLNIVGWNSSYTGEEIPAEEMREWADGAAKRILDLKPRRVLELGCGTGLLLFRIAARVESYWATDISRQALDGIAKHKSRLGLPSEHVRLFHQPAHEVGDLEAGGFDTIILNSVVQYFPGADYLVRVIRNVAPLLAPGGRIFIGDVKNSLLLPAFQLSTELVKLSDGQSVTRLQQVINRGLVLDHELALQPSFFRALKKEVPRIGCVQTLPKDSVFDNEMSRFRYDTVLWFDEEGDSLSQAPNHQWVTEGWSLERLREELVDNNPPALILRGVPNRRILLDIVGLELARAMGSRGTVRELRARQGENSNIGVGPNQFRDLVADLPYTAVASWNNCTADGDYDVIIRRNADAQAPAAAWASDPPDGLPRNYANDPLRLTLARRLVAEAREYMQEHLPASMVPSNYVFLDSLPLTTSGKTDRNALPPPEERVELATDYVAPETIIERQVASVWQEVLGTDQVGIDDNFFDVGGNSLLLARVHHRLENKLGRRFPMVTLLSHTTVRKLAAHLGQNSGPTPSQSLAGAVGNRQRKWTKARGERSSNDQRIAIVGIACRFPGAANRDQYWQNLCEGVESRRELSDEELLAGGANAEEINSPNYVKSGGWVEDIDRFDPRFFNYSPADAEVLDPQHRVFLETCWQALEDAGIDPLGTNEPVGVYGGSSFVVGRYLHQHLLRNRKLTRSGRIWELLVGNTPGTLATRVAYHLNLTGPAVTVQTACSTSLVAVHHASQALLAGHCEMALAGGVSLLDGRSGYLYQQGFILSPDGHCRPFDANGTGTWPSEGVGVVALRRLADAQRDGNPIYAVIRGSAINNDGSAKLGYTAPSVEKQAEVVALALAEAEVDPGTIGFVEAHGTGTEMGDPIEVEALTEAYRIQTDKVGYCVLGSAKGNIGHTDGAAGIAGLIKATLALHRGEIPPTINFTAPNPNIDFENSPFVVNTKLRKWSRTAEPRRAGVTSLGIGGTNAHIVLEEGPHQPNLESKNTWQMLPVSAKSSAALERNVAVLADRLESRTDLNLEDVAYTQQLGRHDFAHRRFVVANTLKMAVQELRDKGDQRVVDMRAPRPSIAMMFPGQGAQRVGMARLLYESEPVFEKAIQACLDVVKELAPQLKLDTLLLASEVDDAKAEEIKQTAAAQPAIFSVSYALARLWQSRGLMPSALIGHSIGELAAACLAGVFSLEHALEVVVHRGRLMQSLPSGAMLAVTLPESEIATLLTPEISLAGINGIDQCVLSGPAEALSAVKENLDKRDIIAIPLRTSHAFHSAMMDPILAEFGEVVGKVQRNAPTMPVVSNVTGTWLTAEQATSVDYWVNHIRQPVRFHAGIQILLANPETHLLEVGPGGSLSGLTRSGMAPEERFRVTASLPYRSNQEPDERAMLARALGHLWLAGVTPMWQAVHQFENRQRISLPPYSFERDKCWVEPDRDFAETVQPPSRDVGRWLFAPAWRQSRRHVVDRVQGDKAACCLLFMDDCGLGQALVEKIEDSAQAIVRVYPGTDFVKRDDGFEVDPTRSEDYTRLLGEIGVCSDDSLAVVHLWGVTRERHGADRDQVDGQVRLGYQSLVALTGALAKEHVGPVRVVVGTSGVVAVHKRDCLHPGKATSLGPALVMSQEHSNMTVCHVDVALEERWHEDTLMGLAWELGDEERFSRVAYRDGQRWLLDFEQLPIPAVPQSHPRLRERGVYLITGGLGAIGLVIAKHLAQRAQAKLALVSRTKLPEKALWVSWVEDHGEEDATSQTLKTLHEIEEAGGEVEVYSADVTDREQMQDVVARVTDELGVITGVIHAAGSTRPMMMRDQDPEAAAAVMAPKLIGTTLLHDLVTQSTEQLDFFMSCSSLSATVGGTAHADYAAANSFLDAYSDYCQQHAPQSRMLSVQWGRWDMVSGISRHMPAALVRMLAETETYRGFSPQEGVDAFERVLRATLPVVVVKDRLPAARREAFKVLVEAPVAAPQRDESVPLVAPETDAERRVAAVWSDTLGMTDGSVGANDNFFDIGGTSVSLVRIHRQLCEEFQRELPITELFAHPTVRAVAQLLAQGAAAALVRDNSLDRAERQRLARKQRKRRGR